MSRVERKGISVLSKILIGVTLIAVANMPSLAAEQSSYTADPVVFSKQRLELGIRYIFSFAEDLNSDGYTDILALAFTPINQPAAGGDRGALLLNNGDNTFTNAEGDAPVSEWPRETIIADFDGDGITDVFIADHGWDASPFPGFKNQLLLGTGSGFTDVSNRLPEISDFTHNAAAADIDSDGDVDILVANLDTVEEEISYFLINDGSANFTLNRERLPLKLRSKPDLIVSSGVELADLDGDNAADLIVGRSFQPQGHDAPPSRVYWNDGNGFFSETLVTEISDMSNFRPAGGSGYEVIEIKGFDYDSDGDSDLLLSAYDPNFQGTAIQLIENLGARQFVDNSDACLLGDVQQLGTQAWVSFFSFLDINDDGQKDIAIESRGTLPTTPVLLEGNSGEKMRAIAASSISSDSEAVSRLGGLPIKGNGEFGIAEVFSFEDNGGLVSGINYVPIKIESLSRPSNRYDTCTSRLRSSVNARDLGNFALDFTVVQQAPSIVIQLAPNSEQALTNLPDDAAMFDRDTGILEFPSIFLDGTSVLNNAKFQLRDPEQLLFELVSSD